LRIKKLELIGFKSFKDKTVILFDAGVTGIVGPNGCGKSNIVDAITWVMGEQSAKHLRGQSMEDLIFGGAEGYAPGGFAEVTLTLENDGGPFPVKFLTFSEISVTRRLHRSGESEYLVNREPARLRDIQEIFMDTGAGSKGFSIIEQGAIGKIITAKPLDRRSLIDEAAGITKFKIRKKESQRKIVATDQNLVRLKDIIAELKRQIDSLQRQAKRAERYRELKIQVEDLELLLSSKQYLQMNEELKTLKANFSDSEDSDIMATTELDTLTADVERLALEIAEKEKYVEIQTVNANQYKLQVREKEISIQTLRHEVEQAERNQLVQTSMKQEATARKGILETQLAELKEKLAAVATDVENLEKTHTEKEEVFQKMQSRIQTADQELTAIRRELMTVNAALTQVEINISSVEARIEEVEQKREEILETVASLKEKESEFTKRKTSFYNDLEKEKQMQLSIMSDVENFEANKNSLEEQLDSRRVEVQKFKDELNLVASRLYGLEDLQANFEGFEDGVKNVMLWKKAQTEIHADGSISQIMPVADVIEVPPEYEVAMEAALGPKLQMLLSHNSTDSLSAVQHLKEKSAGRSSFFASDMAMISSLQRKGDPSNEDGVKQLLSKVISSPEKYKNLVEFITDDIAVVDNIATALRLRPHYTGWNFVTEDGDVLTASGVLTGGASDSADSGMLKQRREIKELSLRKDEMAGKLALSTATLEKLEDQFKKVATELENSKTLQNQKDLMIAELKKDFERAENELKSVTDSLERQNLELSEVENRKLTLEEKRDLETERATGFRTRKTELETNAQTIELEYAEAKQGIDQVRIDAMNARVQFAQSSQEKQGLTNQVNMLEISFVETSAKLDQMINESDLTTQSLTVNQVQLEEEKVLLEKLIQQAQDAEASSSQMRNEFTEISNDHMRKQQRVLEIQRVRNEKQAQVNEMRFKIEQTQMKLQYLTEQMRERYMLDLAIKAQEYIERECDVAATELEVNELKDKIKKIGEVNLSAIQEYDDIQKRYEFLTQQETDLMEAKENLRRVIDRINRICNKRFRETFESVNERFQKVFPVLFGGGEAQLTLVEIEGEDELGIDIMAKPPGKKLQNITLMSGGEKALTSVALIFSIFLVKPSPFCLLDEVDAPLDDANVFRFNDLVREMAKRSQIIIVTHNKNTMEINEKLYGVTMQEKGVSRMVSVSLEEAKSSVQSAI
jgi:chromosome segregation protein